MTHPIHSADAERKVIAAQFKTWIMSDDYEQGETAAYVAGWRHARAAAQVGANVKAGARFSVGVAAPAGASVGIQIQQGGVTTVIYSAEHPKGDSVGGPLSFPVEIAAGAPAETIDQVRANFENWYVTHIDGAVIGSADCAARWSSWLAGSTGQYKAPSDWKIAPMPWGAPAETPKPISRAKLRELAVFWSGKYHSGFREVREGHAAAWDELAAYVESAQPEAATIGAGEGKDAARVQFLIDHPHWSVRWRIQTKKQIQQWQMVDDGEPWGQWGEYRAVVDAARAAMRSKTSPGEAG